MVSAQTMERNYFNLRNRSSNETLDFCSRNRKVAGNIMCPYEIEQRKPDKMTSLCPNCTEIRDLEIPIMAELLPQV